MKKYLKISTIPILLFFSSSIFFSKIVEKIGGDKEIFDLDDEDDL